MREVARYTTVLNDASAPKPYATVVLASDYDAVAAELREAIKVRNDAILANNTERHRVQALEAAILSWYRSWDTAHECRADSDLHAFASKLSPASETPDEPFNPLEHEQSR